MFANIPDSILLPLTICSIGVAPLDIFPFRPCISTPPLHSGNDNLLSLSSEETTKNLWHWHCRHLPNNDMVVNSIQMTPQKMTHHYQIQVDNSLASFFTCYSSDVDFSC